MIHPNVIIRLRGVNQMGRELALAVLYIIYVNVITTINLIDFKRSFKIRNILSLFSLVILTPVFHIWGNLSITVIPIYIIRVTI